MAAKGIEVEEKYSNMSGVVEETQAVKRNRGNNVVNNANANSDNDDSGEDESSDDNDNDENDNDQTVGNVTIASSRNKVDLKLRRRRY